MRDIKNFLKKYMAEFFEDLDEIDQNSLIKTIQNTTELYASQCQEIDLKSIVYDIVFEGTDILDEKYESYFAYKIQKNYLMSYSNTLSQYIVERYSNIFNRSCDVDYEYDSDTNCINMYIYYSGKSMVDEECEFLNNIYERISVHSRKYFYILFIKK